MDRVALKILVSLLLISNCSKAQFDITDPFFVAGLLKPTSEPPGDCEETAPLIQISEVAFLDSTANATEYVTSSFAPTIGDLLIGAFITSDTVNPDPHAITSLHGNWTQIAGQVLHDTTSTGLRRTSLWYCTNATDTSSGVTNKFSNGATGCEAVILKVVNATNAGTAVIVQSVTNSADTATSATLTLGALQGGATNAVIAVFGNELNPFGATAEAGWIEEYDEGYASPNAGLTVIWRVGGTDNTPSVTMSTSDWGGVAVEIAALPCAEAPTSIITIDNNHPTPLAISGTGPWVFTFTNVTYTSGGLVAHASFYSGGAALTNCIGGTLGDMTLVTNAAHSGDANLQAHTFFIPVGNLSAQTNIIVLQGDGLGGNEGYLYVFGLDNVAQTGSYDASSFASGTSDTPSTSVTSDDGDQVISLLAYYETDPAEPSGGATEFWEAATGSATTDGAGSYQPAASSMGWSIAGSGDWVVIATPFNPAP